MVTAQSTRSTLAELVARLGAELHLGHTDLLIIGAMSRKSTGCENPRIWLVTSRSGLHLARVYIWLGFRSDRDFGYI
jgi:hypothetical protein